MNTPRHCRGGEHLHHFGSKDCIRYRPVTHQPKGGMCAACRHALRDCSSLPFSSMPVLARDDQTVIVRCTQFQRRK
ncbi:hypothetical protein [Azotobacter chroococcum]|uniref:hypothetical protein n=1 Tax=Azotobacter chroococcum TaxID=353 RepID=UPI0010AE127B|nr:hypothetical protein [Azotobacter chroococcum]TKD40309.1 hypothetical protein FCG41_10375 [Azotobacter chroococcum]